MGYDTNLEKLAELKDGWDGYDGRKTSDAALATAKCMVAVPVPNGGIQIELHAGGIDIEIHIDPDGAVSGASVYKPDER